MFSVIKKHIFLVLLAALSVTRMYSQSRENLIEINKTWEKFYQAFDSLDYTLMAEIHAKELIRISGGEQIRDYDTYINNHKKNFLKAKENNISNSISLRFFERINNDSIASERGVYQITRTKNGQDEQRFYGQFHVLFKKENSNWMITMDYDSDEEDSIGEDDYLKAHAIDEFDHFLEK